MFTVSSRLKNNLILKFPETILFFEILFFKFFFLPGGVGAAAGCRGVHVVQTGRVDAGSVAMF